MMENYWIQQKFIASDILSQKRFTHTNTYTQVRLQQKIEKNI